MSAARQAQQQKERAKLARTLRRLAKSGRTIEAASHALRINLARAYLIANQQAIEFADCESQEESFSPPPAHNVMHRSSNIRRRARGRFFGVVSNTAFARKGGAYISSKRPDIGSVYVLLRQAAKGNRPLSSDQLCVMEWSSSWQQASDKAIGTDYRSSQLSTVSTPYCCFQALSSL